MMLSELKASIIATIEQSSLINSNWIYTYEPTEPGGFPAIAVTALSAAASFADTQRNRREYTFRIRCYQERQTVGQAQGLVPQSEAERILTNLVDDLTNIFDNRSNLQLDGAESGQLVFVQAVPQEWFYVSAPNTDMRVADIKLVAVVVK